MRAHGESDLWLEVDIPNRTVRSRFTPPERSFFKPAPLWVSSNSSNYRAFNIRTKVAVVGLRQRKEPRETENGAKLRISGWSSITRRSRRCASTNRRNTSSRVSPGVVRDVKEVVADPLVVFGMMAPHVVPHRIVDPATHLAMRHKVPHEIDRVPAADAGGAADRHHARSDGVLEDLAVECPELGRDVA
jgi:hypothetical protein